VAVATELHFGRAAERLRIAQPTLSELVQRLERDVGTPLLTRTTRRVALTGAGFELLGRAKVILDDVAAANAAVRRVASGEAGTVRLGITPPVVPVLAPHLAAALQSRAPDITLEVRRMWQPDLINEAASSPRYRSRRARVALNGGEQQGVFPPAGFDQTRSDFDDPIDLSIGRKIGGKRDESPGVGDLRNRIAVGVEPALPDRFGLPLVEPLLGRGGIRRRLVDRRRRIACCASACREDFLQKPVDRFATSLIRSAVDVGATRKMVSMFANWLASR